MYQKEPVLYIPWFQEPIKLWQPWVTVEQICQEKGREFKRVILPWDIRYDQHSKFSLSAIRERVRGLLENIEDNTTLVTYSLSAVPTLWAFVDSEEKVRNKVSKIVFLHPATNPVHSVAVMDWMTNRCRWSVLPIKHYLDWDSSKVFNRVIGKWNWNWEQFQEDLRDCSAQELDINWILTTGVPKAHEILVRPTDAIADPKVDIDFMDFRQLKNNHIPDLSNQDFIR